MADNNVIKIKLLQDENSILQLSYGMIFLTIFKRIS